MTDQDATLEGLDLMLGGASLGHEKIKAISRAIAGMTFVAHVRRDNSTNAVYPLVMDVDGSEDPVLAVATDERFLDAVDMPGMVIHRIPASALFRSTDYQRYTILIHRSADIDESILIDHEQAASLNNLIELLAPQAGVSRDTNASAAAHNALSRQLLKALGAYFRRAPDIRGVRLLLVAIAGDRTPDVVLLLDADKPAQHHAPLEHLVRPLLSPGSFLRWEVMEGVASEFDPDDVPWFYRRDRDFGWFGGIRRMFRPAPAIPFLHVQTTDS